MIDSTGLPGTFDFTLDWSSATRRLRELRGRRCSQALEEQLGLKLSPAKKTIDIWVVDHAERVPVEN